MFTCASSVKFWSFTPRKLLVDTYYFFLKKVKTSAYFHYLITNFQCYMQLLPGNWIFNIDNTNQIVHLYMHTYLHACSTMLSKYHQKCIVFWNHHHHHHHHHHQSHLLHYTVWSVSQIPDDPFPWRLVSGSRQWHGDNSQLIDTVTLG